MRTRWADPPAGGDSGGRLLYGVAGFLVDPHSVLCFSCRLLLRSQWWTGEINRQGVTDSQPSCRLILSVAGGAIDNQPSVSVDVGRGLSVDFSSDTNGLEEQQTVMRRRLPCARQELPPAPSPTSPPSSQSPKRALLPWRGRNYSSKWPGFTWQDFLPSKSQASLTTGFPVERGAASSSVFI